MEGNFLLMILVFFPFASGLISYLIGRKSKIGRDAFVLVVMAIEFVLSLFLLRYHTQITTFDMHYFASLGLSFKVTGFRMVMVILAGFIFFTTTILTKEYFKKIESRNKNRYYLFLLWTMVATMGIFLSSNLYTTFIFFEIMSFTSYVLVIHNESKDTKEAAKSYVGFAVFGGLVTLMGLFLLQARFHTLEMDAIIEAIKINGVSEPILMWTAILILIGFAIKAGMYPLHTWLPKSYVNAPDPATAILSAILSKCGIFGILIITGKILLHDFTWGMIILTLGTLTMLTGAMLAVCSINFKRTLACSSMSQIGFILVGIGMQGILGEHNALAVNGSMLHLINHSLIKLPLFIIAGVIFMNLKTHNINEIRGFGRKKWILKVVATIAVLAVAGVPLLNGYVSKTLIHESIVEYIGMFPHLTHLAVYFKIIEGLFMFTGGLTFCYMLKILIATFYEKNNDENVQKEMDKKKKYMSVPLSIALVTMAVILPILGVIPNTTSDAIAKISGEFVHGHMPDYSVAYFAGINLKGAAISLAIGIIFYFLIVRVCLTRKNEKNQIVYIDVWNYKIDIEEKVYKPILLTILPFIGAFAGRIVYSIVDWFVSLYGVIFFAKRPYKYAPPEDNNFALFNEEQKETKIPRGISYTLLLFIVGILAITIFIFFMFRNGNG